MTSAWPFIGYEVASYQEFGFPPFLAITVGNHAIELLWINVRLLV